MSTDPGNTHASPGELVPPDDAIGGPDAPSAKEVALEESEERTRDPEGTRRRSTQTPGN